MPVEKSRHSPPRRERRTYVLYDRATGAIVGAHQVAHPAGDAGAHAQPNDRIIARLAQAHGRAAHEFAALEAPGLATGDAGRWRVDVDGDRLVRRHAPAPPHGGPPSLKAP